MSDQQQPLSGEAMVILRRFDSLKRAIDLVTANRPQDTLAIDHLKMSYDQTRSAVERLLGTRQRAYDPPPNPGLPTGFTAARNRRKGD